MLFLTTFSTQIGLGSVLVGVLIAVVAAVGAFRSAGAKTWRENAEAEKARADRLDRDKAKLVLEKAALESAWTKRHAEANAEHVKELRDLTARIHALEVEITELRARPTVDDLAATVKRLEGGLGDLHSDFSGQTGLLTEIRDALLQERRRDSSMRTRKSDPPS